MNFPFSQISYQIPHKVSSGDQVRDILSNKIFRLIGLFQSLMMNTIRNLEMKEKHGKGGTEKHITFGTDRWTDAQRFI